MPKSLRNKVKHLCYNGTLTERERDRILKALEQQPTHGSTYGGVSWGGIYKEEGNRNQWLKPLI